MSQPIPTRGSVSPWSGTASSYGPVGCATVSLFAALLLFAGNLADRVGAKGSYLLGVAAFGVASMALARGASPTRADALVVGGLLGMVVGLLALALTVNLGSPLVSAACLIPIGAGGSVGLLRLAAVSSLRISR